MQLNTTYSWRMFHHSTVFIAPAQRWTATTDPNDVITIERSENHRWIVRSTEGRNLELTGAAIRAQYQVELDP